eukprot:1399363-Rhodomonas_salina.1
MSSNSPSGISSSTTRARSVPDLRAGPFVPGSLGPYAHSVPARTGHGEGGVPYACSVPEMCRR